MCCVVSNTKKACIVLRCFSGLSDVLETRLVEDEAWERSKRGSFVPKDRRRYCKPGVRFRGGRGGELPLAHLAKMGELLDRVHNHFHRDNKFSYEIYKNGEKCSNYENAETMKNLSSISCCLFSPPPPAALNSAAPLPFQRKNNESSFGHTPFLENFSP